jgi:UDP-N-acetylmuramoyl-tripeptide--D-alanyl-D-alanine ligase
MGLTDNEIHIGLNAVKPAPMRLEPVHIGAHLIINDAYNANPTSMAAAVNMFANLPIPTDQSGVRPRRVAVLGDMLELGPGAGDFHRQIGRIAAESNLDELILIGPLMLHASEEARQKGMSAVYFKDVAAAAQEVPARLQKTDAILLKASRGVRLEKLLQAIEIAEHGGSALSR